MERVLTPDEKLRRAEEIYYKRKVTNARENIKTVNVPVSNQKYLVKKMIIQIVICFLIYCTYYVIKNYNFIFSKDVIEKTNQVLSYDIDIQEMYCKVANYINNYKYFTQQNEEVSQEENLQGKDIENTENTNDVDNVDNIETEENNNEQETKVETLSASVENAEVIKVDESSLNQAQLDANEIKQKYSLINPIKGQITSRFGVRTQTEEVISPYHVGLDIAANAGTVILSSMDGTVVEAGELSGYGNCIQIQKDDVLTIYGHCSKVYVNKGDNIIQGQQIGEVAQTGNATGPHLHFEIRKSGRYVDPEMILEV